MESTYTVDTRTGLLVSFNGGDPVRPGETLEDWLKRQARELENLVAARKAAKEKAAKAAEEE